jgi:hypothetical protein
MDKNAHTLENAKAYKQRIAKKMIEVVMDQVVLAREEKLKLLNLELDSLNRAIYYLEHPTETSGA